MTDRELIEWVARARAADALPDEHQDIVSLFRRLIDLGVMDEPAAFMPMSEVTVVAQAGAKRWLEGHPA